MDAIVFDLDGTLVDSRLDIAVSLLAAIEGLGYASLLNTTGLGAMVGRPLSDMLRAAVPNIDDESIARGTDLYRAHYLVHCLDHTTLFAGMAEAVTSLASQRQLGCATTKRTDQAERILAGLDLLTPMALCLGTSPGMRYKPEPDLILASAKALSVEPASLIYVGDTELDLRAAHAAGSRAAWVRWGYGAEASCLAEKPEFVIDTPEELNTLLD